MIDKNLKVMCVFGTRPEIIRLSSVLKKLDQCCNLVMVHTGQNYDYELNEIFFEDLKLRKADFFLDSVGKNPCETIGNIISKTNDVIKHVEPDCLLILGDTDSCIAAYAAKRNKVPIFHMEAGNRCFDQRVPEEINRKLVDHISDINLPYSSIARDYLISEGFPPDRVIKTGSPLYEVLQDSMGEIQRSKILNQLDLVQGKYFLISVHRQENIEEPGRFQIIVGILNQLAVDFQIPVIVSTHPRTRKKLSENKLEIHKLVKFLKPLGFFDYVKLQICGRAVLSDSGSISEESSILNFPALNLREVHERPEAMEEAAVMMVGLNYDRVLQGLKILSQYPISAKSQHQIVQDYEAPDVSGKVVRLLHSYTDLVRREVWKRY